MSSAQRQTQTPTAIHKVYNGNKMVKKDNVVEFPFNKPIAVTDFSTFEDYQISIIGELSNFGTYISEKPYNAPLTINSSDFIENEVRRTIDMYKKILTGFISFGSIGLIAFTSFFVLGVSGVVSPATSIFGSIVTGVLTVGLFADFKKWERRHV